MDTMSVLVQERAVDSMTGNLWKESSKLNADCTQQELVKAGKILAKSLLS